jgi:hypothetical protein
MTIASGYSFWSAILSAFKQVLAKAPHGTRIDWVPMVLNSEEFLAELNRRLQMHPAYRPGMAFHLRGDAVDGERRFDHNGPDGMARAYSEVLAEVSHDFELAGKH